MLVSHIKNLWTLPPPTTWPQEAPPLGWLPLSWQPIPMPRFSEGGGQVFPNNQHLLVFSWVSKGFVFFGLATKVLNVMLFFSKKLQIVMLVFFSSLLVLSNESFWQVNLPTFFSHFLNHICTGILCPFPNSLGVQTCVCLTGWSSSQLLPPRTSLIHASVWIQWLCYL